MFPFINRKTRFIHLIFLVTSTLLGFFTATVKETLPADFLTVKAYQERIVLCPESLGNF